MTTKPWPPQFKEQPPMEYEKQLTIYFVGASREEAYEGLPFDSFESAESYQRDEGGYIYSAPVNVHFLDLTRVED